MKKTLCFLLSVLILFSIVFSVNISAFAQEDEITLYDGAATNQYVPSYSYYNLSMTQYIIPASKLSELSEKKITGIKWYMQSFVSSRVYKVYITETEMSAIDENQTAFFSVSECDLVCDNAITYCDDVASLSFETQHFYGDKNLLITVIDKTNSFTSGNFYFGVAGEGFSLSAYRDKTEFNPSQANSAKARNFLPKTTLEFADAHSHSLTKVASKAATTSADGNVEYYICGGEDGCGKIFEDKDGTKEITDANSVVIPKIIVDSKLNIDNSSISATCSAKNKTLTVKWKAVKNATDYEINYRKAGASKWTSKTTSAKNSYVIKSLAANGLYEFRLRTISVKGKQKSLSSWSSTTRRYIYQAKISKLTSGKGTLTPTWSKDKNATSYEIQLSTDSNFKKDVKKITAKKSETKKTIKSLKKGKKYYVRIRSIKKYNDKNYIGQFSGVKNITTKK